MNTILRVALKRIALVAGCLLVLFLSVFEAEAKPIPAYTKESVQCIRQEVARIRGNFPKGSETEYIGLKVVKISLLGSSGGKVTGVKVYYMAMFNTKNNGLLNISSSITCGIGVTT